MATLSFPAQQCPPAQLFAYSAPALPGDLLPRLDSKCSPVQAAPAQPFLPNSSWQNLGTL